MHLKFFATAAGFFALVFSAAAWDYEGHHAVNELALASLPANFPAFVLASETRVRIAYLAGEADRWRNETSLRNGTGLTLGHASAPDRFPAIDPNRDSDHTRELSGFLPWAMTEYYEKLQSGFSTLAALQKFGGTPDEIANAQQDIVYVMGVMGHFVGDASQPLHCTKYFNGWVGENPNHYTTERTFHQWIDGGFFRKTGGIDVKKLSAKIHPAEKIAAASDPNGIFKTSVDFVVANNQLVEPLYKLEKDGKLSDQGDAGTEGRAFLEGQIVKSGQLLGNLWYTAWQTAPADTYLERELQQRGAPAPATK